MVEAGAAVPLTALISHAARAGLAGLEILTGIPGTVGGALRGNAGGRQGAIGQFVRRATVLDLGRRDPGARARRPQLRRSRLQPRRAGDPLGRIRARPPKTPRSVVRRMRRIWIIKKENQPYGHQFSGCIFKNPAPDVSAGALIDQAGLEGHALRRRRGLRPACQLHRRPPRCQGGRRPRADRTNPPARLAAIRLRIGTSDPSLVK